MKSRWQAFSSGFSKICAGLFLLLLLLVGTERPAQAYVDPGTGMMIWQAVGAAALGVAFYFRKLFSWFRPRKKESEVTRPSGNLSNSDQQGPAA